MTEPDPPNRREALRAAVAAVAAAPARPSATDEVFALIEDIEIALSAGGSIEEVRLALAEKGLALTAAGFRSALYRARRRRKAADPAARPPAPAPAPKPVKWDIPGVDRFKHNPSSDDDVFN